MLKFMLILLVSNTFDVLSANLISRGSVTGHLNNDGLSSTIIKSQQLNTADGSLMRNANQQASQSFSDNRNKLSDPNSHFRLYYKSNSPGRSIKHELEHRFYKNPSFLSQNEPQQAPQYMYQNQFNQMPYLNGMQAVSSYSNVFPNENELNMPTNLHASQYNPNNDQSTMLNLHYHDNIDYDNNQNGFDYNQMLQQQQQQQQLRLNLEKQRSLEQYQQSRRNNLLKMMLMDFAPKAPQQTPATRNLGNNGVQYKIVNLKFKIEPHHGKFIGQGIVGTNNGVPGLLKSKHFNLFPNQLPALVKDILSASNQQQKQEPRLFFKKKRDDSDDSSSAAAEELALNKRDASSNLDDQKEEKSLLESEVTSRMKRNMDDIENEIRSRAAETEQDENQGDERERRSDEEESEDESSNEEKVDDNDFRESFKSLQRRNDEEEDLSGEEDGNEDAERQERGFDEEDGGEESALMERSADDGEQNDEGSENTEEVSNY